METVAERPGNPGRTDGDRGGDDGRTEQARIAGARRAAERQGYRLVKSRVRDPLGVEFGWHVYCGRREVAHLRTLGEVETWLRYPETRA